MNRVLPLALLLAALTGCGRSFVPATPAGFVDMGTRYRAGEYRATSADGAVIGIRAFDNDPKGELPFWTRIVERRMHEMGGYAVLDKRDVAGRTGVRGVELRFGHDEGREPYLYRVVLFVTDAKVFVLEAGGTKAEMTKQEAQIDWAIRNFSPK